MNGLPDRDRDPDVLAGRLGAGWALIDREPDPDRRARLEGHWLSLLGQYVAVCDGDDHRRDQKADNRFAPEVRHGE